MANKFVTAGPLADVKLVDNGDGTFAQAIVVQAALPAGTNAIGTVEVTALPATPAGTNAIGTVEVTVLPALPAGTNAVGTVEVTALPALPAGTNAVGTVEVTALPATPAGTNAIGTVQVTALPALPAGTNAVGTVEVTALPALPVGTNAIGTVEVTVLPAIPAGTNAIGKVEVTALPATPAGTNAIGKVEVTVLPVLPAGTNTIGTVAVSSVAAGENHLGSVGGDGNSHTFAPTITSAGDYTIGDCIGAIVELANIARADGRQVVFQNVLIADKAEQQKAMQWLFFTGNPTNSTTTDNAALVLADEDADKLAAVATILSSDYVNLGNVAAAQSADRSLAVTPAAASRSLWVALRATETATYTVGDVVGVVNVLKD